MKAFVAAIFLNLVLTLPAVVQEKPAPQSPPAAPPVPSGKQALEDCRTAVLAKGLDEATQRRALAACIIEASPKIAKRLHCLMDPRFRSMEKDARMAAIATCVQSGD